MKKLIFLVLIICPFVLGQGNSIPKLVDSLYTKTSHIVNVKEFGAVGDGTTDDTQAFQDALDYFYNSGSYRTGKVVAPIGNYKITRSLTYQGTSSHSFTLEGEQGSSRGTTGTTLIWYGKEKGVMMYLLAANSCQLKNFAIYASTLDTTLTGSLETGIWMDCTNSDTAFSAVNITSFEISSNVLTIETDAAHHLFHNRPVRISGVTGYNGLYLVDDVVSPTSFTISYYGNDYSTTGGTAQRVKSGGSSGMRMEYMKLYHINGYDCAGLRFANGLNTGTEQVSEVYMEHIQITGNDSLLGAGLKWEQDGNTKNFYFEKGAIDHFNYGFHGLNSGILGINDMAFANLNIFMTGGTAIYNLKGIEGEGTLKIAEGSIGSNPGIINMYGCSWQINALDTTDVIYEFSGVSNFYGNDFRNARTGISQPKFIIGNVFTHSAIATAGGFTSIGNWYKNATGYPAVYIGSADSSNLVFNGSNFKAIGHKATSIGDIGGVWGAMEQLKNYSSVNDLVSTDSLVASNGFIRMSKTDSIMWKFDNDEYGIYLDTLNRMNIDNTGGLIIEKLATTNLSQDTSGLTPQDIYQDPKTGALYGGLSANVVTNGDFTDWTGDNPDGWTVYFAEDAGNYVEENPTGELHIITDGNTSGWGIRQSALTLNIIYGYSFEVTFIPSDTMVVSLGGVNLNITAMGVYTGQFTATNALITIRCLTNRSIDFTLDNFRVWQKIGGAKQTPIFPHPSSLGILNQTVSDTLPCGYSVKPRIFDSLFVYDIVDSICVQAFYRTDADYDLITTPDTLTAGEHTIVFDTTAIPANAKVYLYFIYLGDSEAYLRSQLYWSD